ncbi:MAG: ABC transporter permease [Polyangiaceae bacterium]|nr:ABC transporter permease [Polyangiaceae bacterium]
MNPIQEVILIVQRELRKNFRSVKGIVLLILSLLGGGAFAVINAILTRLKTREMGDVPEEQFRMIREQGLTKFYDGDADMGRFLSDSPDILWTVSLITIWLTPLLVAVLGYDGVSGEVQHRTVRFWTVRSRRTSYFMGKFFGLWLTVSGVTLVMHLLVWIISTFGGVASAGTVFGWGLRYWMVSIPIAGAWSAIAVLIASQFRTPMVSLLSICIVFFVLFCLKLTGVWFESVPLTCVYPGTLDNFLLNPQMKRFAIGLAIAAGFIVTGAGAGSAIFAKRDV